MRLWTIQGIEIYNKMQKDGFAYCTLPNWRDSSEFMRAYRWMSGQMKRRIGEPPIKLNTPSGHGFSMTVPKRKDRQKIR